VLPYEWEEKIYSNLQYSSFAYVVNGFAGCGALPSGTS
jgi:hypothetical protein